MPGVEENLPQAGFNAALYDIFNNVDEAYVLLGDVAGKGQIPVGMGVVKAEVNRAWPHVWWFPEATPRLKLEITAHYIVELRKRFLLLIVCKQCDKIFFNKFSNLGLTKRVGTIDDWDEEGPIALYQSRTLK